MKTLKKISLRGLSTRLTDKEMKNVLGGSGSGSWYCWRCSGEHAIMGGSGTVYCSVDYYSCLDHFADDCLAGGAFYSCKPDY
jgi:natural product precursor